jgi:hypothetical protein
MKIKKLISVQLVANLFIEFSFRLLFSGVRIFFPLEWLRVLVFGLDAGCEVLGDVFDNNYLATKLTVFSSVSAGVFMVDQMKQFHNSPTIQARLRPGIADSFMKAEIFGFKINHAIVARFLCVELCVMRRLFRLWNYFFAQAADAQESHAVDFV